MWPITKKNEPQVTAPVTPQADPAAEVVDVLPFAKAIPPQDPNQGARMEAAEASVDLYLDMDYKMTWKRKRAVNNLLHKLVIQFGGGSLLDVGCGRGEAMALAREQGFTPVHGTEVVPVLLGQHVSQAYAHALPFANNAFEHVTAFAMLSDLTEADIVPALRELSRVARRTVTFSAEVCEEQPVEYWNRLCVLAWDRPVLPCGHVLRAEPAWQLIKPMRGGL